MLGVVSCYLTSLITICVVVKVFKNISLENFKFNKKLVLLLIFGTLISTGLYYLNITILKTLYSLFFFILVFKLYSPCVHIVCKSHKNILLKNMKSLSKCLKIYLINILQI